jgi:hypothetical protein
MRSNGPDIGRGDALAGVGLLPQGEEGRAIELFSKALEARPDYTDAIYALNFLRDN